MILRRSLQSVQEEECQENRGCRERETTTSMYSVESGFAIRTEKVAACSCKKLISISGRMGKSLKGSRQGSRFAAS